MRLLVALSRFPYPTDKGDKLRAYYQLVELAKHHEIFLVCLSDETVSEKDYEQVASLCEEVHLFSLGRIRQLFNLAKVTFSNTPFQVGYFQEPKIKACIERLMDEKQIDLCYVQLVRMFKNIPFKKEVAYYLDYMDAFSLGMAKRATKSPWYLKPVVKEEARRLAVCERKMGDWFDRCSIITATDAKALKEAKVGDIDIVPNGICEDFFELPAVEEKSYDVALLGNMGYYPNVEASKYLVQRILPLLSERLGRPAKACLIGISPSAEVQELASEHVEVTGFVEDVREYLLRSSLFVAPLFAGQGLQNKILEAMACGIPVVTSPLAYSAIESGEQSGIEVCSTPEEFAQTIEELLNKPQRCKEISQKGRTFVKEHYNWKASVQVLEKGFLSVIG